LPGALVLLSPCVDLHLNGDTETTLREADPALDFALNKAFLRRTPRLTQLKKPHNDSRESRPGTSPKGFPPVLIQGRAPKSFS